MKEFKHCKDCPHFKVIDKKKFGLLGVCHKFGETNIDGNRTACNSIYGKKSSAEIMFWEG